MRRPGRVPLWRRARRVLGINARNVLYVHGLNARRHFRLADDKILTKQVLSREGVPIPETLAVLGNLVEVAHARGFLEAAQEFVIKPARGRQGGGIMVLVGRDGSGFRAAGGLTLAWEDLRRAMADILFGVHGYGQSDRVLIERRVRPHPDLAALSRWGLPDVRVLLLHGESAMAMMRIPTRASGGRANLHRGALGAALRLSDGMAFRCVGSGGPIAAHPDGGGSVTGFTVPLWSEVLAMAARAARALPLPYVGVDVVLADRGVLVMEVNARPGLEIQNVNARGLRRTLERLAARGGRRDARDLVA